MMNKKEKLEFLKKLESNPRVSRLWYDPAILKRGRDDSIWYDGCVLNFIIDKRWEYSCVANGDVRIFINDGEDEVIAKGGNSCRVVEFLEEHGIRTDKQVTKSERKRGGLVFEDNNWFDDVIYDLEKKEYVSDQMYLDISDGPFSVDLDYLDEIIKCAR